MGSSSIKNPGCFISTCQYHLYVHTFLDGKGELVFLSLTWNKDHLKRVSIFFGVSSSTVGYHFSL